MACWIALALALLLLGVTPVGAAEVVWSEVKRIPGYAPRTETPILVADTEGRVHAFASEWVEGKDRRLVILYRSWTPSGGWTDPVAVIEPPYRAQAAVQDALIDRSGMLHLVFFGGDDVGAHVYYTRAHVASAASASAWTWPEVVGRNATPPRCIGLAEDDGGRFVVVYAARLDRRGLFVTYSEDRGDNWSEPEPVFWTEDDGFMPASLDLAPGESGRVHAVWTVVNHNGARTAGYYMRFDVPRRQWNGPIEIAASIGIDHNLGLSYPTVIEHDEEVLLFYNNGLLGEAGPPANWVRRSVDGGSTWTEPMRPFPELGGRNGMPSLAVDGGGTIHALFGQRIPRGGKRSDLHGLWHSMWRDGVWSPPQAVVSGPRTDGFDPNWARTAVLLGNTLLATWKTDPGCKTRGTWSAFTTLAIPPIDPVPYEAAPLRYRTAIVLGFVLGVALLVLLLRRSFRG